VFDEDIGTVTIIADYSPDDIYKDDCNRFECSKILLWAKNPLDLAQEQLHDLEYTDLERLRIPRRKMQYMMIMKII
jgi:hypothetical protein